MRILLTNDDGVNAPGINNLYEMLQDFAEVIIVAPDRERSASGHAITLNDPLKINRLKENIYACSGFPADCVIMGLNHLLKGDLVDLVISGVNRGANLAQDIYYSGTVAGAREGAIMDIPSISVSLSIKYDEFINHEDDSVIKYDVASKYVANFVKMNGHKEIEQGYLTNINVPNCSYDSIKGIRTTFPGFIDYPKEIDKRRDTKGRPYYWIGGRKGEFRPILGSDCLAIADGYISVSTLKISGDPTDNFCKEERFFERYF